jgi:hypothetical protein
MMPLSAAGLLVAVASVFIAAAYDRWLHLSEAGAFLGAMACAMLLEASPPRWRGLTIRIGASLFLGGLFLALLPLSCG